MWVMAGRYQSAVHDAHRHRCRWKRNGEGAGAGQGMGRWADVTPSTCRPQRDGSPHRASPRHVARCDECAGCRVASTFRTAEVLRQEGCECGWHAPIPLPRATSSVSLVRSPPPTRGHPKLPPTLPSPPGLPTPQGGTYGAHVPPFRRWGHAEGEHDLQHCIFRGHSPGAGSAAHGTATETRDDRFEIESCDTTRAALLLRVSTAGCRITLGVPGCGVEGCWSTPLAACLSPLLPPHLTSHSITAKVHAPGSEKPCCRGPGSVS